MPELIVFGAILVIILSFLIGMFVGCDCDCCTFRRLDLTREDEFIRQINSVPLNRK